MIVEVTTDRVWTFECRVCAEPVPFAETLDRMRLNAWMLNHATFSCQVQLDDEEYALNMGWDPIIAARLRSW